uniref:Cytochrome P450 2J6 n=2 Tax=Bursaphelenchus xylophilus TaxID=6326 RepID=A0A1I7SI23_BURXY
MNCFMSAGANLVFNNPWLYTVPVVNRRARSAVRLMHEIFEYLNSQIQHHLKENDYSHDAEATDFIDAFLLEKARRERDGEDAGIYHVQQLRNVCFDMWIGGQETTSSTITWIIAFMIRYPEAQAKMQRELDAVIGSKRIVRNEDRPDLPYTNAVIMECQRSCNLFSQNVLRVAAEDTEIKGYAIKKGTIVVPQVSVLFQNPKIFPEPHKFDPDRFIDQNGKLRQVEELIPFSLGKRICLGEGMARMELFIFTANLFNQYKFESGKVPP